VGLKIRPYPTGLVSEQNLQGWYREVREALQGLDLLKWVNLDFTDSTLSDIENRSHTLLTDVGDFTHDLIDIHINDDSLHFTEGSVNHGNLSGLDDIADHTWAAALAGRSGGQTINGDITLSGGDLTLQSNPEKDGTIILDSAIVIPTIAGTEISFTGAASQSGNMQNWIDSSSNVLASVSATGKGTFTKLEVAGAITIQELSSDPTDPTEGKAVFWMGDGTGTGADGDLLYMEQSGAVVATGSLKWTDFVPSSITENTLDSSSGSVSDVQAMFDGNVYQIEETTGAPGYDVEFIFSNVDKYPTFVVTRWIYDGLSTHYVTWDIWNYNSSAWDTLRVFKDSDDFHDSMTMYIPRNSNGNYVSGGAAKIRVYHQTAGNASHNIQIDYVGLTHSLQGVI